VSDEWTLSLRARDGVDAGHYKTMSPTVKVQEDILACPKCGEEYLHQETVLVETRMSEDSEGIKTMIYLSGPSIRTYPARHQPRTGRGGVMPDDDKTGAIILEVK